MQDQNEQLARAQMLIGSGFEKDGVDVLQGLSPSNPYACFLLAQCLRHGIGVPSPQPKRAFEILIGLVQDAYIPAIVEVALQVRCTAHMNGLRDESVPKDHELSIALLDLALELEPNNEAALCARGLAYLHGRGCEPDDATGRELLEKAVRLGDVEAKCWLGRSLLFLDEYSEQTGSIGRLRLKGISKRVSSMSRGRKLLVESANAGFGHAHINLARLYRDVRERPYLKQILDEELTPDELKAKSDYHDLMGGQLGAPAGFCNVAESYSSGSGSYKPDFDMACKFCKLAFASGFIPAADALGYHLEKGGEGNYPERINMPEALLWYERGRSRRHAASALHLGEAYDDGIGVEEDPEMAEKLYLEALDYANDSCGDSLTEEATTNLSRLYLAQRVMAPDSPSEKRWSGKLENIIGPEQCRIRHNRVRSLLNKLSDAERRTAAVRRVRSSSTPEPGPMEALVEELRELVGEANAQKLVAAYSRN